MYLIFNLDAYISKYCHSCTYSGFIEDINVLIWKTIHYDFGFTEKKKPKHFYNNISVKCKNQMSVQKLCGSEMFWRHVWIFRLFSSFNQHVCLGIALLNIAFVEHRPIRRYRGKLNFVLSLLYLIADFLDGFLKYNS